MLNIINNSQLLNLFLSIEGDIDEIEALKKKSANNKNNILIHKNIKREINKKRNRFVNKVKNLNYEDYLTYKEPNVSN